MTMELEQTLQKRLDESNVRKEKQLAQVKEFDSRLQNMLKKLPKRPRETVQQLDDRAKSLERKRCATSIPLVEERQILKQINVIEKEKRQVEEYNKMDEEIQLMKKQLSTLRHNLNETFSGTDEIRAALEKVKLANKLECGAAEISSKEIDCPKAKLGKVIGKNGSMLKHIEDTCKVSIVVDKETDKLTITGSEFSLKRATEEIERITRKQEEEIVLEKSLLNYLTSKYVNVIQKLREEYTNSFVDVVRGNGALIIKGIPEDVAEIKGKIFDVRVISKQRLLTGREAKFIIGKKGTTIERLCIEHMIPIDLSKENDTESNAIFTGPSEMVEAALSDVEKLINDNREVETKVNISSIKKRILLAEGGRHMKAIQTRLVQRIPDGNCYVSIAKDFSTDSPPEVLVKAKQLMVSDALQFVVDVLKEFDELIVERVVDPYVAPRIIGKGGETVKKITGGGNSVFMEIDKLSGEVSYGTTSAEGLEDLSKQVDELFDNNSTIRVKADPSILKYQFRELIRSKMKKDLNELCRIDINEDDSCYIIYGKKQNLENAKVLLDDFLLDNQFTEVPITDEDREEIMIGGKKSKIMQFSEEMDVKLQMDNENLCVRVCGSREKVDKAEEKLNQFLNGGNGFDVMKFSLNEQVVGKVIGKGGKVRKQLEEKYDGVTIFISRAHVVTIRGPSQVVTDCRVEIAKMVASARVIHSVAVSDEQKISLEKKEYAKKILQQMPVSVTTTNDKVVLKGTFHDVRDAVSLLNEMLTGEYKTFVELDALQFCKVRNTLRDPSHFDRMETTCGAKVELDLTAGSISVSGKRSNVKRAKDQVYGFLDFMFPKQLCRLKITKPLYGSVGRASTLAEISAQAGGVAIYLDRDLSLVVIRSIDEEKVRKAAELVKGEIEEAERLAYVFEISVSDSWIIPIIIGKKGANISRLRSKCPGCKIDVSKDSRTIAILGESEEIVQEAREAVRVAIEKARSENVFISIQQHHIPSFLGKGGSHVKELSAKYEVEIQRVRRKGNENYKISGEESNVKTAKEAIDAWLDMREKAIATLEMTLEREQDISAIIGHKGVVARSIEKDYNCRFDVDKKSLVVTVRSPDEGQRVAAINKMKDLIETYHNERLARELIAKEQRKNAELSATAKDVDAMEPVKNENVDLELPAVEEEQRSQLPTQPVGVAAKSFTNGHGKKKKVDTFVNEGTEAGKSLFALLTSED